MTKYLFLTSILTSLRRYKLLIFLLISAFSIYSLDAQIVPNLNPEKHLSQYVLRNWSTEDGLKSESSNELIQSDDGYIWIATYNGLHRFDGKDFTVFDNDSNLPSVNVARLEKGKDGTLWIGSLHGVAKYFDGEFHNPESLKPLKEKSIEDMLLSESGELWVSTKSNELYHYVNEQLYELTDSLGLNQSTVLSIEEDSDGNIYFGTDNSQFIRYSTNGAIDQIELGREVNGVLTLFANKNEIYIGTGRGLYIWNQEKITKHSILPSTSISSIILDENNILWIGTLRGLFRYQESTSKLDSFTETNGMPNNIVRDMIFDRDGNLWVGTYRNGIFFLSDGSMTSYTKNDGLATNIISSVTEIDQDSYLLGNENGELNIIKNGDISNYNPPIQLPSDRLKNLFTDKWGRIWASTYGGLFVLDGANGRKFTINNGFPDNFARIAFQDNEDKVWVGTKNAGLFRFNSLDDWEQITVKNGLSSNYIMSIDQNQNGEIIVGTINGLNIIKDMEVINTVTTDDGLPSNFMFTTLTTPNFIWMASNDGLTGYSDEKVVNFNTENGLPSNIIYDILLDSKGDLWLPSENSVISVNLNELETAAANDNNIQVRQFDKSHGMKNS
ncbi:MAG: two-component regulator propeller domain-containing protein, partial [Bacteroidota bacterium]